MKDKSEKMKERRRQVLRTKMLLTAGAVILAVAAYTLLAPSRKKADPLEYYNRLIRENGGDSGLGEGELAVVLQNQVDPRKAMVVDEHLYLSYSMVRENLSTRFYWDEETGQMRYVTAEDILKFPVNSRTYETKEGERSFDQEVMIDRDGRLYISADFVQQYVNAEVLRFDESSHVVLNYRWGTRKSAVVGKKGAVREEASLKSSILTRVAKGDVVTVLEEGEKWMKVMTADGFSGYYRSKYLSEPEETKYEREFTAEEIPDLVRDERINLVWHQIGVAESNDYLEQDTADMTGVNVISPTWFSLSDNEGSFTSLADRKYVRKAHKAGWEVWGLVDNFSSEMSLATLTASSSARARLIDNLVEAALDLGLDGINIDFEYITSEGAYDYVQFIRELSVETRKAQLVLSVDVPVSLDFNSYFDRSELGAFADYVIIMGYDEHYVGSEAGSVASLPFEEKGIVNTLKEVPARKVISGVPFYTRLWYTGYDASGSPSVWSEILGMNTVTRTLESYGVEPVWDEQIGQNYAVWDTEDGINCQIWIEDEASIEKKAQLVSRYDLGGIAAWALGSERKSIWKIISEQIGQETAGEDTPAPEQEEASESVEESTETAETERAPQGQGKGVLKETEEPETAAEEEITEQISEGDGHD
ncbi:MAG: glycosyl hydrolase family 18 protein [Lachnospiraceae bacterium]|nr:glycosyl hydrolase family 18 protein [Lachnospiraceae bacterium]